MYTLFNPKCSLVHKERCYKTKWEKKTRLPIRLSFLYRSGRFEAVKYYSCTLQPRNHTSFYGVAECADI